MKKTIIVFSAILICLLFVVGCKAEEVPTGNVRLVSVNLLNKPSFVGISSYKLTLTDEDGSKVGSGSGSVSATSYIEVGGVKEGSFNVELEAFDNEGVHLFTFESTEKVVVEKEKTTVFDLDVSCPSESSIFYYFYATKDGKLKGRKYLTSSSAAKLAAALNPYVSDGKIVLEQLYSDCVQLMYPDEKKYSELKALGYLKLDCLSSGEITGAKLPDSSIILEDKAFYGFEHLAEINLSKVKEIGNWAFANCTSLSIVVLPEDISIIRDYVFSGCTSLLALTEFSSVDFIGTGAFKGCSSLNVGRTLTLKHIGDSAFENCTSLAVVVIDCPEIYNRAFSGCTSLTDVELKKGIQRIGDNCFNGCTSLAKIKIPDTVKTISGFAFDSCNLSSVFIPESVETIDYGAFANCGSVTVNYEGSEKPDTWDDLWYGLGTTVVFNTEAKAD